MNSRAASPSALSAPRVGPLKQAYGLVDKCSYAWGIRSTSELTLPDFIGIGTSQGGSTWLYQNLALHPEVYIPKKEIKYFNKKFHKSLASYAARFEAGRDKVKGEITPEYAILPQGRIRFIRHVLPDLRLIYVIRNPIERSWSMCRRRFATNQGRDIDSVDETELIEFLRTQPRKPKDYGTGLQYNAYLRNIDSWLGEFSESQLFVGFFQDIAERPKDLLTQVFDFLGVSRDIDWESLPYREVINKNAPRPMPPSCREVLEEMYRQDIEELHQRFGAGVASWRC
jgi:hypothetical protein